MFKRRRKKKGSKLFDKKMADTVNATYRRCLTDILKLEAKKTMPSGNETIDFEETVRAIKVNVRMTLAFVDELNCDEETRTNGKKPPSSAGKN